ncbi:MAG: OmpA family protein [Deltaproteobacteria bacterium]|nr:OmpA family protein [Deltaproteobacteria bacterium]
MLKHISRILAGVLLLLPLGLARAAGDPNDAEGSKDPPLFSRMAGFHIYNYQDIDFDRVTFATGPDKSQVMEGRHYVVIYYANDGIKLPSGLQVVRNYTNAVKSIGGKQVYAFEDGGTEQATLRVETRQAEVWAQVQAASNGMYNVHVVERQLMNQDVAANADSLAGSLRETGKAAVYGIYFDTDKAKIEPASEPALSEIAKLLKAQSGLKLYVVGHTDNAGSFDHNVKLSAERAAAVTQALVRSHGIAASRLKPFGVGPTAPVASNGTEEGRAKNRRVELVAQ